MTIIIQKSLLIITNKLVSGINFFVFFYFLSIHKEVGLGLQAISENKYGVSNNLKRFEVFTAIEIIKDN